MRHDFYIKERAQAEVFPNGCRVYRKTSTNTTTGKQSYSAMFFFPKSTNPVWYYSFKTVPARRLEIAKALERYDAHKAEQAKHKAARKTGDLTQMDAGTILKCSWGYDQTNVNYYQVTERKGFNVKIAPIAQQVVKYNEFMSEYVRPVKDGFILKCRECGGGEMNVAHGSSAAFEHAFDGYIPTETRRIAFWNGEACVATQYGTAHIVKTIKFGNADDLVVGQDYQSHYC